MKDCPINIIKLLKIQSALILSRIPDRQPWTNGNIPVLKPQYLDFSTTFSQNPYFERAP